MAKGIIIENDIAKVYIKSLKAVRKRLISAFEGSDDLAFRKWVNTHGSIIDDLIEELGGKV